MLIQILCVLLGGLAGHLLTRQYSQHQERESEAHKLRLAVSQLQEFESCLRVRYEMPNWNGPIAELESGCISEFLQTRLSYLLGIRGDFQQVRDWIIKMNAKAHPVIGRGLTPAEAQRFADEARTFYQIGFDPRMGLKNRILNALLYTTKVQYWLFGKPPTDRDILKGRTEKELVFLEVMLDNLEKSSLPK
jgi:hypothetical protein